MAEPARFRSVPVALPAGAASAAYEVRVGEGIWDGLPALLEERCPAHRYALITDDRVAGLHAGAVEARLRDAGLRVDRYSVPEGERHKTRESWAVISDRMLDAGVGRDAAVLALGGGVVGDLAGFVAATYMRGLPLVQLPTTLLAMIDSSVGGKTGVDTPAGKNLIGAFHQPQLVVADTRSLATLPREQLRAGLAEALKHGAIADADYLAAADADTPRVLDARPEALEPLIVRSVEIKAAVVARDEREAGPRKALNFGHTIGHAVEALSGYRLLHGEAVAIGMVAEARLGERLGVTAPGAAERLREILQRAELPVRVPGSMAPEAVAAATRSDKKARAGRAEYALLERLGAASPGAAGSWSWPVDDALVLEVLRELAAGG